MKYPLSCLHHSFQLQNGMWREPYCDHQGFIHGGILSGVLDEVIRKDS
jgi:hypothetical protein